MCAELIEGGDKGRMDSKGSSMPSLAIVALIIFLLIIIAAFIPPVKETILDFLSAIFGNVG